MVGFRREPFTIYAHPIVVRNPIRQSTDTGIIVDRAIQLNHSVSDELVPVNHDDDLWGLEGCERVQNCPATKSSHALHVVGCVLALRARNVAKMWTSTGHLITCNTSRVEDVATCHRCDLFLCDAASVFDRYLIRLIAKPLSTEYTLGTLSPRLRSHDGVEA